MSARSALRVVGDALITAGLVVALFAVYEVFYTGVYTGHAQARLRHALDQQWASAPKRGVLATRGAPALGDGVAILYLPRLGAHYAKVIVEGVQVADLRKGPGHYPGSALPGQVGNFVVSGHRTTYGAPFGSLNRLRVHDPIVLETRDAWYVYRVTSQRIVTPTAIDVTDPVPDRPGARARQALLTFTTCHPRYSARQRLVVFAVLDSTRPRSAGVPQVSAG